jgi:hypothetical protein
LGKRLLKWNFYSPAVQAGCEIGGDMKNEYGMGLIVGLCCGFTIGISSGLIITGLTSLGVIILKALFGG